LAQIPLTYQNAKIITAKTFIATGHKTGAVANGVADDTDTLQQAINYAIAMGCSLELEPGTYRITKGLLIEAPVTGYPSGFMIHGQSGANRGANGYGGVSIYLDPSATKETAILTIGHAAFRDMVIENIGLVSGVPNTALPYGILFAGNRFGHVIIHNVTVKAVQTGFAILEAGNNELNGEQVDLDACMGIQVNCFYDNEWGQAYNHHITNCCASVLNGGTAFRVGESIMGFSLDVYGFTSSFYVGPLQNTFFQNNGISGPVNFSGGRQEHVDTVLKYMGGTPDNVGMLSFSGLHFAAIGGAFPFIDATLNNVGNCQWTNSFLGCLFEATPATIQTLWAQPQTGDMSMNIFERCVFRRFSNAVTAMANFPVLARDCRASYSTADRTLYSVSN
jgi:hypothetical protein